MEQNYIGAYAACKAYTPILLRIIPMKELNLKQKHAVNGFPDRLKKAIGQHSVRSFSLECGVSDRIVRRYLQGEAEPTLSKLIVMSDTANVSLEWLATGENKESPGINRDALTAAVDAVDWAISEAELNMTAERKSQLLAAVYRLCLESDNKADKGLILEMIRSVA